MIWVVAAKTERFGVIVYFAWYFFVIAIRLFLHSLFIAKSKHAYYVQEQLNDALFSMTNCIYYFCVCFLPIIEFTLEENYFPELKSKLFSILGHATMAFGLFAFPVFALISICASHHKYEGVTCFSLWSFGELLMLVSSQVNERQFDKPFLFKKCNFNVHLLQIFLLNPMSLVVFVVVLHVLRVKGANF